MLAAVRWEEIREVHEVTLIQEDEDETAEHEWCFLLKGKKRITISRAGTGKVREMEKLGEAAFKEFQRVYPNHKIRQSRSARKHIYYVP